MLRFASLFVTTLLATQALALSQANCAYHALYLNTENGYTPCDIASFLVGDGGMFNVDLLFRVLKSVSSEAKRLPVPGPRRTGP